MWRYSTLYTCTSVLLVTRNPFEAVMCRTFSSISWKRSLIMVSFNKIILSTSNLWYTVNSFLWRLRWSKHYYMDGMWLKHPDLNSKTLRFFHNKSTYICTHYHKIKMFISFPPEQNSFANLITNGNTFLFL